MSGSRELEDALSCMPAMMPAELMNFGTIKDELAYRNPKVADGQRYSSWREETTVAPKVTSEDEASGHYY